MTKIYINFNIVIYIFRDFFAVFFNIRLVDCIINTHPHKTLPHDT